MDENPKKQALIWSLIVLLALIWGSSFLVLKRVLVVFSPLQVFSGRMFFATLVLMPVALRQVSRISLNHWPPLMAMAIIANFATTLLNAIAQTKLDSSLAGILNTLTPLMTLGVGAAFYQQTINRFQLGGILVGLVATAALLVIDFGGVKWLNLNAFGLFVLAATLCMGLTNNIIKFNLQGLSILQIASVSFLLIFPVAVGFGFVTNFFETALAPQNFQRETLYLVFLGVFSNALALLIMAKIIQLSGPVTASLVTYLIPVVAVLWGWWDGELISAFSIAVMIIILLSLYVVNRNRGGKQHEEE